MEFFATKDVGETLTIPFTPNPEETDINVKNARQLVAQALTDQEHEQNKKRNKESKGEEGKGMLLTTDCFLKSRVPPSLVILTRNGEILKNDDRIKNKDSILTSIEKGKYENMDDCDLESRFGTLWGNGNEDRRWFEIERYGQPPQPRTISLNHLEWMDRHGAGKFFHRSKPTLEKSNDNTLKTEEDTKSETEPQTDQEKKTLIVRLPKEDDKETGEEEKVESKLFFSTNCTKTVTDEYNQEDEIKIEKFLKLRREPRTEWETEEEKAELEEIAYHITNWKDIGSEWRRPIGRHPFRDKSVFAGRKWTILGPPDDVRGQQYAYHSEEEEGVVTNLWDYGASLLLKYGPEEIRNHKHEIMNIILRHEIWSVEHEDEVLGYVTAKMRKDPVIAKTAMRTQGENLHWLEEEERNNWETAWEAVNCDGTSIRAIGDKLKNNPQIIAAAVIKNAEEILQDREVTREEERMKKHRKEYPHKGRGKVYKLLPPEREENPRSLEEVRKEEETLKKTIFQAFQKCGIGHEVTHEVEEILEKRTDSKCE